MSADKLLSLLRQALKKSYLRISVLYVLSAFVWISISDPLLGVIVGDNTQLLVILSTGKGYFYVGATALALWYLMRREYKREQAAAERLQRSEEAYRYLFLHNPRPMWIYDLETLRFVEVNAAALLKYGYTRDEFLAMDLYAIRPEEDHERLR